MRKLILLALVWAVPSLYAAPAAELKVHGLFSDHMVLQSDQADPIWGTAEPGREVAVSIAGQKKIAHTGADGRWKVKLDPLKAGGPHELAIGDTITLKDVMVGEVWICSGQSNMEMSVNSSNNAAEEKANATFPKIRLYTVPRRQADQPEQDVVGSWKECGPDTVGGFSAVAYFFGREVQRKLGVPIGLVHTSWGGTPAEVWTSDRVIQSRPEFKNYVTFYAQRQEKYEKDLAKYKEDVEKAKAEGKPAPKALNKPMKLSCLYNAMIAPLIPYGIRGAIWYQGESNASQAKLYQTLFPAMITNWREDWGQGEFPFGFVQLANFMARRDQPGDSNWAELREAQTMTLSLPKTGMAVIVDIGDAKDIHPKNKQDVGKRLAFWAESQVYGDKEVVFSGPIFESARFEGSQAAVSFKHVGGGLRAQGDKLTGFAVAGDDRKFAWADAKIDGDKVVVTSSSVAKPVSVRYAWADNPDCNLYNKEGLPASPFRSDSWDKKPPQ